KLLTSSDTPSSSSTCFMVTGKVAELELVLNAKSCAGLMALKKSGYFILVNSFKMEGYTTSMTKNNPPKTTKLYFKRASSKVTALSGLSPAISTIKEAIKANTPYGAISMI